MRVFVSFLLALSKLEQRMGSIVEADNLGEAFAAIVNAIGRLPSQRARGRFPLKRGVPVHVSLRDAHGDE
ncbi:MAG: hypothetical protein IPK19_39080 [Chloroflexi bacterium]|nr:hypothetical protein [Chloroflexota bacterium]